MSKYQTRWKAKKDAEKKAEAAMPQSERTYRQRLNALLFTLVEFRQHMPVRSPAENMTLLAYIIGAARTAPGEFEDPEAEAEVSDAA